MNIFDDVASMQAHARARTGGAVLVPTMGALHRGHLELIRLAGEHAGVEGEVTVSIFVNPLQFEPGSDFNKYPRPQSADEEACRKAGVDVLFRPADMYFPDRSVYVEETALAQTLCGASRPGHFRGVCTVVAKLFHLTQPHAAVFGEKDYQQLAIIRRMVRDLNFPIEILAGHTVREPDGLALSSRNQYLSATEREQATVLRRAALAVKEQVASGQSCVDKLIEDARAIISSVPSARVDYVSIIDGETLLPRRAMGPNTVLALAVWIGQTRLIDNLRLA